MKYRTRTFYTDKQKSEMWGRWQRGESLSSIGHRFDRASSSIFPHLALTGGIRPRARIRSGPALSLEEREEISRGLAVDRSLRSIARALERAPWTISWEVRRNSGRKAYRAAQSDQRAWDCARRPKACKLSYNEALCPSKEVEGACAGERTGEGLIAHGSPAWLIDLGYLDPAQ